MVIALIRLSRKVNCVFCDDDYIEPGIWAAVPPRARDGEGRRKTTLRAAARMSLIPAKNETSLMSVEKIFCHVRYCQ